MARWSRGRKHDEQAHRLPRPVHTFNGVIRFIEFRPCSISVDDQVPKFKALQCRFPNRYERYRAYSPRPAP